MGNFSALTSVISGMRAAQRRLEVHSHNISNASTPGYQRQSIDISASGYNTVPAVWAHGNGLVGGVNVAGITRDVNQLGLVRWQRQRGDAASAEVASDQLRRLENAFPEPDENALGGQLTQFWTAFQALANHPSDTAARVGLLAQTDSLVSTIRRTDASIVQLQSDALSELDAMSIEINDFAQRIASVNDSIYSGDPQSSAVQDLKSQRDLLAGELADRIGAQVNEMGDGNYQVIVNGRAIVDGNQVAKVTVSGGKLKWVADMADVKQSGKAGGLQNAAQVTFPSYRATLDSIVNSLVTKVNGLHAAGYDQNGNTGINFFAPAGTTAATIAIDTSATGVGSDPTKIAAGAVAATEDGEQARQIAAIATDPLGPDTKYEGLVAGLGVETRLAMGRASASRTIAANTQEQLEMETGVNLDEETLSIVAAQRAYQAAARVVSVVDEMLDTLINRMGR